jgi:hypothetical protein
LEIENSVHRRVSKVRFCFKVIYDCTSLIRSGHGANSFKGKQAFEFNNGVTVLSGVWRLYCILDSHLSALKTVARS